MVYLNVNKFKTKEPRVVPSMNDVENAGQPQAKEQN